MITSRTSTSRATLWGRSTKVLSWWGGQPIIRGLRSPRLSVRPRVLRSIWSLDLRVLLWQRGPMLGIYDSDLREGTLTLLKRECLLIRRMYRGIVGKHSRVSLRIICNRRAHISIGSCYTLGGWSVVRRLRGVWVAIVVRIIGKRAHSFAISLVNLVAAVHLFPVSIPDDTETIRLWRCSGLRRDSLRHSLGSILEMLRRIRRVHHRHVRIRVMRWRSLDRCSRGIDRRVRIRRSSIERTVR